MTAWFNPDAIRGDFEKTFTDLYYPPAFSAAENYAIGDRVRFNGKVYVSNGDSIGSTPPSIDWTEANRACKIIYENVEANVDPMASMKILISWFDTSNESISCEEGTLRSITGTFTCWIATPKNQGTSAGLQIGGSVRQTLALWRELGTCGEAVRASVIRGPRSSQTAPGLDYYAHVVTATLTAMEQVPYLR